MVGVQDAREDRVATPLERGLDRVEHTAWRPFGGILVMTAATQCEQCRNVLKKEGTWLTGGKEAADLAVQLSTRIIKPHLLACHGKRLTGKAANE